MINFMKLKNGRRRLQDKNKRLEDVAYVAIDTELTGLNEKKDSIVSIGAVRMTGGRIELGNSFYRMLNPKTALSAKSVIIHEITPLEVMQKPAIESVLAEFLDFCDDAVLVGYCVSIDMGFLNRESKRITSHEMNNPALDIQAIHEWTMKKVALRGRRGTTIPQQYKLYDIAKNFSIPVNGAHNAKIDAYITAQIFQRFIPVLIASGIRSIGELLKLSEEYKGGDRHRIARGMSNF
jgi:DNA polymerase III subunit epsilon